MILIADSGSSKTAWKLIDGNGVIKDTVTQGLNLMHISRDDFRRIIQESDVIDWPLTEISQVYFYGAGHIDKAHKESVKNSLHNFMRNAEIETASDLLAAARAGFADSEGIIGILGTGSNSGYYDGRKIAESIAPLGYILGDEGSGTALGKAFITKFLRNQLPEAISASFKKYYPNYSSLLPTIYSPKASAKVLASVVPFLVEHKRNSAIMEILYAEFMRYILLLRNYESNLPVILVGSVAYYFREEIINFAQGEDILIEDIIQSPIERLTQYHSNKLK